MKTILTNDCELSGGSELLADYNYLLPCISDGVSGPGVLLLRFTVPSPVKLGALRSVLCLTIYRRDAKSTTRRGKGSATEMGCFHMTYLGFRN